MTLQSAAVPAILTGCFAAVFTYEYVRRTFWARDETRDAALWYGHQRNWDVRQQDLDDTAQYVRASARTFGALAIACWLLTLYLAGPLMH